MVKYNEKENCMRKNTMMAALIINSFLATDKSLPPNACDLDAVNKFLISTLATNDA